MPPKYHGCMPYCGSLIQKQQAFTERYSVIPDPQERLAALIARKSALLDIMLGKGHIILFGMRPQYRGQSYLTFKLFFNAVLYH